MLRAGAKLRASLVRAMADVPWTVSLSVACVALGCNSADPSPPGGGKEQSSIRSRGKAKQDATPVPLTAHFLARAIEALSSKVPKDAQMIEIRATNTRLSIQMVMDEGVGVVTYQESPSSSDGRISAEPGDVAGPTAVPVYGDGSLEENAFSWQDADVAKIARAFGVARKAVDPTDGWVRALVIRRYLPFGTGVRARIYIESPRMSGSIDTNGEGIPLKR